MTNGPANWYFISTIVIAIAALTQALALVALAAGVLRARRRLIDSTRRVEQEVLPLVSTLRGLLEETSPKLKLATDHLLEVSSTLRLQVRHVNDAMTDVVDKTHAQANRVDEMVTVVLDGVARAGDSVQHAMGLSARQIAGIVSGVRAGFDVLRGKRRQTHSADDGETFI